MKTISSFTGEHRFLSNFLPCRVVFEGDEYASVEHAYVAAKTTDACIRERVRKAETPGKAKRIGRTIIVRDNWDAVKLSVMTRLILQKFKPGSDLAKKLADTGEAELQEGNTWGDTFWGVCEGVGENHLGRILMGVRSQIKRHGAGE
jgi:ribA/ribD-fused uncharacterized protein